MKKIISLIVIFLLFLSRIYPDTSDYINSIKEKLATDNPHEKLYNLIELAEYYKYDTAELSFLYAGSLSGCFC